MFNFTVRGLHRCSVPPAPGAKGQIARIDAVADNGYKVGFIVRRARPTGHLCVEWKPTYQFSGDTVGAYGFVPLFRKFTLRAFGSHPGYLARAYENGEVLASATFVVTEHAFHRSLAVKEEWRRYRHEFRPLTQDCVSFGACVAAALELNVPTRRAALLPLGFLRSLTEANVRESVIWNY